MFPSYEYIKKKIMQSNIQIGWVVCLCYSILKTTKSLEDLMKSTFLYFEDVDICYRANKIGFTIASSTNKNLDLIHFAQRKSFKNIKYYLLYFKSFITYYKTHLNI